VIEYPTCPTALVKCADGPGSSVDRAAPSITEERDFSES
jgi:hypothetical protein